MDILGARRSIEQKLLMQSVALMALVAVSGTIMGIVTGSSAVLLDGVFSFVDVVIKIMMLMTAKLVARETSKRFQFGFWQFEPLVLAVEGFFILLIVIYALSSGITDLLSGGRHVDFGPAIYYAIFFTVADTAYYLYVRRINKSLQSNLIKFDNVNKVYSNGLHALKNVSLEIKQGEFVAIIGLSGAGKSTLLRTINRMHDISEGSLTVNGQEVNDLSGKDLRKFRRKVGMVFQSFNLVTRTTVINNVLTSRVPDMPLWKSIIGLYSKEDKVIALEALDKVGILDKAYVRADQLSGGQQQRVALARTLAQKPEIILADEPVAALDPITAKQVMDDFKKINKELNMSVLINIHHVDLALKYADRVIGIKAGEIVYDGPATKVDSEVLKQIYGRELAADEVMGA